MRLTTLDFAGQPKSPVVIEVHDVQADWLLSERGEPCEQVLEALQNIFDDHDHDLCPLLSPLRTRIVGATCPYREETATNAIRAPGI